MCPKTVMSATQPDWLIFWDIVKTRHWFETLEITDLHKDLCSKIQKSTDSAPGVAKTYTSECSLIFEKKIENKYLKFMVPLRFMTVV